MLTTDQFVTKWNGKGIDFDGAYGDQCMDLMHQYIVEVLGLTDGRILAAEYARYVYESFSNIFGNQYFEKIANTATNVPQKGDILFWKANVPGLTGIAGHVAIFINGDVNSFNSFDQNYPTATKCHIQHHTYAGLYGWLRFKQSTPIKMIPSDKILAITEGSGSDGDKLVAIRALCK